MCMRLDYIQWPPQYAHDNTPGMANGVGIGRLLGVGRLYVSVLCNGGGNIIWDLDTYPMCCFDRR